MSLIYDFFKNIYDWVLGLFSACLDWLLGIIKSFIEPFVTAFTDAVPDMSAIWDHFQPLAPYTCFINKWIALDYALVLLAAYFTFILIMIPVKLIIKLFIPTVG